MTSGNFLGNIYGCVRLSRRPFTFVQTFLSAVYPTVPYLYLQATVFIGFFSAFWNRWTLGLDFGPGKHWTLDRYYDPKTQKKYITLDSKILRRETHRSKINTWMQLILCVFGPIFPEISVQSPAFPSPKSRPRVQRFQNAFFSRGRKNPENRPGKKQESINYPLSKKIIINHY